LIAPVVSTTESALVAELIIGILVSVTISVSVLASVPLFELVSSPILGSVPIRVLSIGDSIVVMVTQSITDPVSILIHKHPSILILQLILEFHSTLKLVAISHLTGVIRKNDPAYQDQNGPD
jgi:hypothetical protein